MKINTSIKETVKKHVMRFNKFLGTLRASISKNDDVSISSREWAFRDVMKLKNYIAANLVNALEEKSAGYKYHRKNVFTAETFYFGESIKPLLEVGSVAKVDKINIYIPEDSPITVDMVDAAVKRITYDLVEMEYSVYKGDMFINLDSSVEKNIRSAALGITTIALPKPVRYTHVLAVNNIGVIGSGDQLPWHSSEDFKHFKNLTKDGVLIMGRKTYNGIANKLPGRTVIVLSRDPDNIKKLHDGDLSVSHIDTAFEIAAGIVESKSGTGDVFVVGGREIYKAAIVAGYCDRVVISHINNDDDGDTHLDWEWDEESVVVERYNFDTDLPK